MPWTHSKIHALRQLLTDPGTCYSGLLPSNYAQATQQLESFFFRVRVLLATSLHYYIRQYQKKLLFAKRILYVLCLPADRSE